MPTPKLKQRDTADAQVERINGNTPLIIKVAPHQMRMLEDVAPEGWATLANTYSEDNPDIDAHAKRNSEQHDNETVIGFENGGLRIDKARNFNDTTKTKMFETNRPSERIIKVSPNYAIKDAVDLQVITQNGDTATMHPNFNIQTPKWYRQLLLGEKPYLYTGGLLRENVDRDADINKVMFVNNDDGTAYIVRGLNNPAVQQYLNDSIFPYGDIRGTGVDNGRYNKIKLGDEFWNYNWQGLEAAATTGHAQEKMIFAAPNKSLKVMFPADAHPEWSPLGINALLEDERQRQEEEQLKQKKKKDEEVKAKRTAWMAQVDELLKHR